MTANPAIISKKKQQLLLQTAVKQFDI